MGGDLLTGGCVGEVVIGGIEGGDLWTGYGGLGWLVVKSGDFGGFVGLGLPPAGKGGRAPAPLAFPRIPK